MTLYGSVGVKQRARAFVATVQSSRITAVARASQPSNRQPEYATVLKRFLPYTHCRLFFFLFTSCQTCPHSSKTTRVDQCKWKDFLLNHRETSSGKKALALPEWTSLTQLWRSNILQHSALLCLLRSHFETRGQQRNHWTSVVCITKRSLWTKGKQWIYKISSH